MATRRRPRSALIPAQLALLLFGAATACGGSHESGGTASHPAWSDTAVTAVSPPVVGSGVTAVTALSPDGRLRTVVDDLAGGKRLWAHLAVISGRPAAM